MSSTERQQERKWTDCFRIDLVDAANKTPFPQHRHHKDGKIYVEVEPNTEFFVSIEGVHGGDVQSLATAAVARRGRNTTTTTTTTEKVALSIAVDGQGLGWAQPIQEGDSYCFGLKQYHEGQCYDKALRFRKIFQNDDDDNDDDTDNATSTQRGRLRGLMGKVEAKIFEYNGVNPGSTASKNYESTEMTAAPATRSSRQPNPSPAAAAAASGRKRIRTEEGSSKEAAASTGTANLGRQLGSIQLQYCTVEGLMFAGVIPRFNDGDNEDNRIVLQQGTNNKGRSSSSSIIITPKKMKRYHTTRMDDGREIRCEREFDFFDLSQLPSSDDENNHDDV